VALMQGQMLVPFIGNFIKSAAAHPTPRSAIASDHCHHGSFGDCCCILQTVWSTGFRSQPHI